MAISATINRSTGIAATMPSTQERIVVTKAATSTGALNLSDLADLNYIENTTGSMLSYNDSTAKWDVSVTIQSPNTIINGGYF